MSNYLAVRVGKKMPNDFQKMELRATCELSGCGATFNIFHHVSAVDNGAVPKQIEEVQCILKDEHVVEEQFRNHLESYELD
jgi:hypothetical protein